MDQAYWLGRARDAIANAQAASFADVKLIHYGLARRYRLEAANAAKKRKVRPKLTMKLSEQLTTAFEVPRSVVNGLLLSAIRRAMTNEERFIASCESVGEADVRQKLSASRFSGQKALWAGEWLEIVESAKSDSTKAEERSSGLRLSARDNRSHVFRVSALLLVLLLASVALLLLR